MDELPFLIVDILASEYGWTQEYILGSLYFDEVKALLPFIKKRQLSHYKMLLAISENPHRKETEKLWELLNTGDEGYYVEEQLDKAAFENLKKKVAKGGGMVVK